MNEKQHLITLSTLHTRRLQKLHEMRAVFGLRTDPAILLEIEDIELELQTLRQQLDTTKSTDLETIRIRIQQLIAAHQQSLGEASNLIEQWFNLWLELWLLELESLVNIFQAHLNSFNRDNQ